jgi:hypothetical protein
MVVGVDNVIGAGVEEDEFIVKVDVTVAIAGVDGTATEAFIVKVDAKVAVAGMDGTATEAGERVAALVALPLSNVAEFANLPLVFISTS